jgi:ATP-dependent DNA helicase RecG
VFCTRWNGLKKGGLYVDALDNDEFQSNAISLLVDALRFVRHNSSVKWKKTGTGRIEMPDYPQEAVHEALVNALVHRDYMIQGSEIHIDIYDNRLEIVSPGGMLDGAVVYRDFKKLELLRGICAKWRRCRETAESALSRVMKTLIK